MYKGHNNKIYRVSQARNCHMDWWTRNVRKVFFFWDTLYIIDLVLYVIFKGYMQYTKYEGHNNANWIDAEGS